MPNVILYPLVALLWVLVALGSMFVYAVLMEILSGEDGCL